nr:DNA recombination protein RmuC [Orrella marina]
MSGLQDWLAQAGFGDPSMQGTTLLLLMLGLLITLLVLALVMIGLLWRARRQSGLAEVLTDDLVQILQAQERLEQVWRTELGQGNAQLRAEIQQSQQIFRQEILHANEQFRSAVARDATMARTEINEGLERFAGGFAQRLDSLVQANERRMQDLRDTVDKRLQLLQQDNAQRLDQMQRTVDEKLHATLEQRLGESFRQVSDRLEAVHKGLGEMQALAIGVGDLKRVLTNVKTRGTWGEVQLMRLIEDVLTPDQYATNVKTVPGSDAMVEVAIRLPGKSLDDQPVWLPIDAKFPKEEYERLQDAQDRSDKQAVQIAATALGRAIEAQARLIAQKYLAPPHTTDFGVMFLASESLYAEALRLPGLLDRLQSLRINVAGPANLGALLSSLQMGFKTLAIEQRSSEVWQTLRAVKTEFGKFGQALADVRKSLESASNRIGQTETRTRVMLRTLKHVEGGEEIEDSGVGESDSVLKAAAPSDDFSRTPDRH